MNILIIDDEQDIKPLFEQRYKKEIAEGMFNFEFVFSSDEAIDYINEHDSELILILSDIKMPGKNGIELLKDIRKLNQTTSIYMITAYDDEMNYKLSIENGANKYLVKPIDFLELKKDILLLQKIKQKAKS